MTRLLFLATVACASAVHAAQPVADPVRPLNLALARADLRAALDLSKISPSAIERPIDPKTSVDWSAGRSGVKAEAGYLCGLGGIGPDSEPIPGGPASVYSHAGTFLGAALAVPLP